MKLFQFAKIVKVLNIQARKVVIYFKWGKREKKEKVGT